MTESTKDRVISTLEPYDLKHEGGRQYRANRPWSDGSDSLGLSIMIEDGEHGTFFDHVDDVGGSLYDLAERLGIPPNGRFEPVDTKRTYEGLEDYALAHGVDKRIFIDGGWIETLCQNRPALKFITSNGPRYRFLDGKKPIYISTQGYTSCWYGLDRAIVDAKRRGMPLVICNGESSTVTAQYYGVTACAITSGERKRISDVLLDKLKHNWNGEILIAPDCDDTGRQMAKGISLQLKSEGYSVRVVDLNGGSGFDLADFCALHKEESPEALLELDELNFEPEKGGQSYSAAWAESENTDTANADRFVKLFGEKFRHVSEWGWMVYGKSWEVDNQGTAMKCAKETARSIYQEAANAATSGDDERAQALAKWAKTSLSRVRLEAMIVLAQSELSARPEEFDKDTMLLNVQNGILDLNTGELKSHDPAAMITKLAGTYYDPNSKCPTWIKFLNRILNGNEDLISYIQRLIGYSLTGSVVEQILLFLYGLGANGKTTLLNALLAFLGDYGTQAAPSILLKGERHPAEIADLRGTRFVSTVEVQEGRQMAEVLVKQLTGGDRVKARLMHRNWFEFEPTFKIWLAANHKPVIRGTDHAIWRRIKLIPFEVTIPEEEQDKELIEKLKDELPGILNWAVRGCLEWQEYGLEIPEKVKLATDAYKSEMDILQAFINDCCIVGPDYEATAKALYKEFSSWCEENGERAWKQTAFGIRLRERGFDNKRRRKGVAWLGIGLKEGEL